jgi:7-cyano-7-deazaguanine synthase
MSMKRLVMLSGGVDSSVLQVVALGHELGVPLEETWSCVASGEAPCGVCAPCLTREEAFALVDAKALVR